MDSYRFKTNIEQINAYLFPEDVPHRNRFSQISFEVSEIAYAYCTFEKNGYQQNDLLNVLKVVADTVSMEKDKTNPHSGFLIDAIDKKLPFTAIKIPKFLRGLPLYPSPQHRKADEIRELFARSSITDTVNLYRDARAFLENAENGKKNPFRASPVTDALVDLYGNVAKLEYF